MEDLETQFSQIARSPGCRDHARTRSQRRLLQASRPARHVAGLRSLGVIQVSARSRFAHADFAI